MKNQLASRVDEETELCPLYGALPLAAQRRAILPAPAGKRKVVLATNIAETSLTIDGIRLVVDSALERAARFDVRSGVTRLQTQRVSRASMTQRAGRAGRLSPGICLHLISREQAERAAAQSEPEILQSDLSALWLDLLQWGCRDVAQLSWIDTPPLPALQAAQTLLRRLGAIDEEGRLTAKGRAMAALGSEPSLAALLTAAKDKDALATAARLTAILRNRRVREAAISATISLPRTAAGSSARVSCKTAERRRRLGGCRAGAGAAGAGVSRSHCASPRRQRALSAGGRFGRDARSRRRPDAP